MSAMTPERLAQMRALVEQATAGPWEQDRSDRTLVTGPVLPCPIAVMHYDDRDAAFIAVARSFVPNALAHIERLEVKLSESRNANFRLAEQQGCDLANLDAELLALKAHLAARDAEVETLKHRLCELEVGDACFTPTHADVYLSVWGTAWHHAEKMAANEMRCRVANQDAVRHQAERADTAEAALATLRGELHNFRQWLHERRNAPTLTTIGGILHEMDKRGLTEDQ